jgi:Ca2+:H+ antiporter
MFKQTAARVASTSLTLAAIGLIIPTIFHVAADQQPGGWSPQAEQRLSVAIAAVLFVTYLLSLVFSLVRTKSSSRATVSRQAQLTTTRKLHGRFANRSSSWRPRRCSSP